MNARRVHLDVTPQQRFWLCIFIVMLSAGMIVAPAGVFAQTSGNAPVLGKAVQGQSAAGVEGTAENAINYLANVIGPLIAGGFFVHAFLQWHSGGRPMRSALTGVGLLTVSQSLRLIEWLVLSGQGGIH